MLLIENNLKIKQGKKWKERWVVLKKLSPVASTPSLIIYKDNTKTQEKEKILLENFYGVWQGRSQTEGEEHLLSIITLRPIIFSFISEQLLVDWRNKITKSLRNCQHYQVSLTDDCLPVRYKSDSRRHLIVAIKKQHNLFITNHHVTITTQYPSMEHMCSWQYTEIKEIAYESSSKIRLAIDQKKTGFYSVSLSTKQAKELHLELLKYSENFWKTRKSPKHPSFPIQSATLRNTGSDLMFPDSMQRYLMQPSRKTPLPAKACLFKAQNNSLRGSGHVKDTLTRHHSDYNLPVNASSRKLSHALLRKVHHSSDEIQAPDPVNCVPALDDSKSFLSKQISRFHSKGCLSNKDEINGSRKHKSNKHHRSSTSSSHFPTEHDSINLPPKRYSLSKLRHNSYKQKNYNLPYNRDKGMSHSVFEDRSEMNEDPKNNLISTSTINQASKSYSTIPYVSSFKNFVNSFTISLSNTSNTGHTCNPMDPLPYKDLTSFDGNYQPHFCQFNNNINLSCSLTYFVGKENNEASEDYLQPDSLKGLSVKTPENPVDKVSEPTHKLSRFENNEANKVNENYISIEQMDIKYPKIENIKVTNKLPSVDSAEISNQASSLEDSVFLNSEPNDMSNEFNDDHSTVAQISNVEHSFEKLNLKNLYNQDITPPYSSNALKQKNYQQDRQQYINIYTPAPSLPPRLEHLHTRSGSTDHGRMKRDSEPPHSKPPLPKRSAHLSNNSPQYNSSNRPFSAKSSSLKRRKPDLTIDTGVHAGFDVVQQRRAAEGKTPNMLHTPGMSKEDNVSLSSISQDLHQSSPSLASSKPRTGREYINRNCLNEDQTSPSKMTAFSYDMKVLSVMSNSESSPHTPSTSSSYKSPFINKPDLLPKNYPNTFVSSSTDEADKKINYAVIDMVENNTTLPTSADHTVYAKIDYLATKAVSNINKHHTRQRENSLDKPFELIYGFHRSQTG